MENSTKRGNGFIVAIKLQCWMVSIISGNWYVNVCKMLAKSRVSLFDSNIHAFFLLWGKYAWRWFFSTFLSFSFFRIDMPRLNMKWVFITLVPAKARVSSALLFFYVLKKSELDDPHLTVLITRFTRKDTQWGCQ